MARKDVAMVKPGQQQKRGNSNGKTGDEKESKESLNNKKTSPSTSSRSTPPGLRRSSRQTTNPNKSGTDSYLSSDPNFAAFRERLDAIGLELRDIVGDGNCLFRALSDQLDGSDCDHLKHREDVVRYMLKHENDFAPFVEDDVPFAKHVDELRQPGTFAGNDAIVAFARLHKVNIIIHQLDAPAIEIKGADDAARQLHISYHNGDHYSSVRRINDSTNKPVNIRLTPIVNAPSSNNTSQKTTKKNSTNAAPSSSASKSGFTDLDTINHIMERTGCEDVELVKSTLADNDNNVMATVDSIMAMLTFARGDSAASSNDGVGSGGEDLDSEDDETSNMSGTNSQSKSSLQKGRSQQIRTKKAEKKLRRMQERRDQYLVSKGADGEPNSSSKSKQPESNNQADVVIINSAKLNIVSV